MLFPENFVRISCTLANLYYYMLLLLLLITERRWTRERSLLKLPLDLLRAKGLHDYLVDCLYRNQI